MDIDSKEDIFLANCRIHELASMKPKAFLERLRHINFIRTQDLRIFTILPISEADWIAIDHFCALIKKGDFGPDSNFTYERPLRNNAPLDLSVFYSNSWPIFAVYVPSDLFYWFNNNNLNTIQKQIKLFAATTYFVRGSIPKNMAPALFQETKRIIENYYTGKKIEDYSLLEKMYKEAALDYFNSQMPIYLPSPGVSFNEDIYLRTAFFRCDDWNRIVHHKISKGNKWQNIDGRRTVKPAEEEREKPVNIPPALIDKLVYEDDMDRGSPETDQETWSKWLITYQRYPLTKSHIYSLFSDDSAPGHIYIFKSGESNRYKIGWTEDRNIEKRKSSLQTGSPDPLIMIDMFPASSRKTEQTIHRIYQKYNISGEWFELTEEDLLNLRSPDWRKRRNIF